MDALRAAGLEDAAHDAVASGPAVPRDLRRHADAVRRPATRTPAAPGLGVHPGPDATGCPPTVKRPQMQWNQLDVRARRPDVRRARRAAVGVLRALAARRARPTPTSWPPRATTAARSTPRSAGATCSPRSSTRRSRAPPASRCWPTSSRSVVRQTRPHDRAVPGDRPARRAGGAPAPGRLRRPDHLRRRPGGRGPRRSPTPARRGCTSSTSTRRAAVRRSTDRSSRRSPRPWPGGRGCRPAAACAPWTTPARWPTPASPAW